MNKTGVSKQDPHHAGKSDWIWEILIFATVVPGVVYGILSIGSLPVV